ncbi:MAG: lipoyl(octanoyl) transferase LipB [Gemmatimonadales bacterium]|nr:MAG: lipoyl(octanoyl) transferase LipB [Gemmatimonadales bacterium]
MTQPLLLMADLGRVPYLTAHRLQHALRERRITGQLDADVLLLLEHEPTVTLGRGTKASSLPLPPEELTRRGLTVAEVERGGDVTWHGPGQLVGYPIVHLSRHREDLHWYLRQVEEVLIGSLADLGIQAGRNPGYTGVWTGGRKIASIGVHVRQWVTTHGFALNVSNDASGFDLIVPCGIENVEMTSVIKELGDTDGGATWQRSIQAVTANMGRVFGLSPRPVVLGELLPGGLSAPELSPVP